jgi:prepilin-type processing-associated H-X9-DG protein
MSYPRRHGGFTLMELLLVFVVIGLLIALLMPAVQGARESAHSAHCQNNLHQLAIAYHHLASQQNTGVPAIPAAPRWISLLSPYLESVSTTFVCPNDSGLCGGALSGAGSVVIADKPPSSLQLNVSESSSVFVFPEQLDLVLPCAISVDLSKPGTIASKDAASPGSIPAGTRVDSYLLHYDPPGKDGEVHNVKVAFAGKILGVIIFTQGLRDSDGLLGVVGTTYDKKASARGMEPGAEIVTLSADMLTFNVDRLIVTGVMEEARIITEPGGVGVSSYGINSSAGRFTTDANKILLLEYHKIVADVVGAQAGDVWTQQVAPRHRGMLNVLFADGHVESLSPADIDPRMRNLHNELWCPTLDRPL